MYVKNLLRGLSLFCLLGLGLSSVQAETLAIKDPDSGLYSWRAESAGVSLQLIQLLPDMVAALYGAQGLPVSVVKEVAGYCVFGSNLQNNADSPVHYRVADWRYVSADGQARPVKTKSQWVEEWQAQGVDFGWSILPDEQTFEPGDWSQGFTTLPLPPDNPVELTFTWRMGDAEYRESLRGMRCAPKTQPVR